VNAINRDYLFIDDNVEVCLAALAGQAGIYNGGSGVGGALRALMATVERVTGRRMAVEYHPARASDIGRIVLDVGRARERLGWVPSICIEDGVGRTWRGIY
jgi:UDP-glucose 4-epimerase